MNSNTPPEHKDFSSTLNDFEKSLLMIKEGIDEVLNAVRQAKGYAYATNKTEQKTAQPIQNSLPGSVDLSTLPWKSYQTKEAAKPDEAACIFANTIGAEALTADLKTHDKSKIGNFEYSFSGKEKQFIARKAVKT
jgi:hypothetical protein